MAQKPACKDHGRNGQRATITTKATYMPVSNHTSSRSVLLVLVFSHRIH
ncbi:acetyltransferase [Lacticaseibacillus paracasei]|nr:acetyltransferase [Lacticaseibacillus paracasei]